MSQEGAIPDEGVIETATVFEGTLLNLESPQRAARVELWLDLRGLEPEERRQSRNQVQAKLKQLYATVWDVQETDVLVMFSPEEE